jgi:DGQHR domain-containing protein
MSKYQYRAIRANQAEGHDVFVFAAKPSDILAFSEIDRVGRTEEGQLTGFQRHQISSHIKEIRGYLNRVDAILPNAVILAFIDGVKIKNAINDVLEIEIDTSKGKPGFVVDGQQRLTALSGLDKPGFEVFVSGLICKDYNELRQQFVLINNTRPLPKTLIYELLPAVDGLPDRFTARKFAARIVDRLNHTPGSSLYGEIKQHTNPSGMLSDTALQKLVMNSASDGAIRTFVQYEDREERAFAIVDEFFAATVQVFGPEWHGMSPRHSRLRHGAGLVAMGFVMDLLYASEGAVQRHQFETLLTALKPYTAWTSGQWQLADNDERPWNGVQNTPLDIDLLTRYLVSSQKRALRKLRKAVNG